MKCKGSEKCTTIEEHYYSSPSITINNNSKTMDFYDQIAKKDRVNANSQANYAYIPIKQLTPSKNAKPDRLMQRRRSTDGQTSKKTEISAVKDYHNIWSSAGDLTAQPAVPDKAFSLQTDDESEAEISREVCKVVECRMMERDDECPPKITETSGILPNTPNKVLVRPIAFKPVIPQNRAGYSPDRSSFTPISHDDGYSSRETSRSASHSASTTSRDSDTYSSPTQGKPQHEFHTIPINHENSVPHSDVERLLSEKKSEIARLRQTMEQNESAIIRVQEQKRIEWEKQMQELAQEYHRRLRLQQDSSQDREAELRQAVAQLELDKRQLSVDIQQNEVHRDRQDQLSAQVRDLKQRNTEISQKLADESCECELLRHQNKDLEIKTKALEEKLNIGQLEQQRLNDTIKELESGSSSSERVKQSRIINQLNKQLNQQEKTIHEEREGFRQEQEKWKNEKEKVLQYQKQLQRTYVQMYKRNNELEQQLCRINSRRRVRSNSQSSLTSTDKLSFFNIDLDSSPESFC